MDRRLFLTSAAAALTLPSLAQALDMQDYTPGLVDQALADGKTVFLDFKASWCTTCAAQERALRALVEETPAYEENILFIAVDWDQFRGAELTKRLAIPRRSTLVVLKGGEELGRLVAQTSKTAIKELLDTALAAA